MSVIGAPSKALKVRPPAAKHYQLSHSCPLPNSLQCPDMMCVVGVDLCSDSVCSSAAKQSAVMGLVFVFSCIHHGP